MGDVAQLVGHQLRAAVDEPLLAILEGLAEDEQGKEVLVRVKSAAGVEEPHFVVGEEAGHPVDGETVEVAGALAGSLEDGGGDLVALAKLGAEEIDLAVA